MEQKNWSVGNVMADSDIIPIDQLPDNNSSDIVPIDQLPSEDQTSSSDNFDPLNPSQGTPLINRIPAANREFLRSIGTGEDAADAYMRGLNNPSKSETLQAGAIRGANEQMDKNPLITNMPEGLQTFIRFREGMIPSAIGKVADIMTDPKEVIGIAMAERFPTLLKQIAPGIAAKITEFANKDIKLPSFNSIEKPGSADVQDMIKQASSDSVDMAKQIRASQTADIAKVKSDYTTIKNGLEAKIGTLDNEVIPARADQTTLDLRKKFPVYAKDISKRFGADYEKAIASEKIATQNLYDALGKTVDQSGMLTKPESNWSDSERKIFDYYNKIGKELPGTSETTQLVDTGLGPIRQSVPTGQETMSLSKVDKQLNSILSSKTGSQYTSGDHIFTIARENMADALPNAAAIKAVRAKFAPELQAKNELYKITQPFNRSGNLDTTKGINFFSNYAKGNLNPDENRLIQVIKSNKNLGSDMLDDLNKSGFNRKQLQANKLKLASEQPANVMTIKQKYGEAGKALIQDHQNHMEMLNAMKQMAIADETSSSFKRKMLLYGAEALVGGGLVSAGMKAGRSILKES